MLNRFIEFSLKHRLFILGLAVVILGLGLNSLFSSRVDVFPDLNRPTVTILTEGHGLAPQEVEALVSVPIEAALNGTPGLIRLRSQSGIGISVVWAEFDWGTDIWRIRQLVNERLALARERLPKDVIPMLAPVSSIMGEIYWVGLTSEPGPDGKGGASWENLRTFADWSLRPRLLSIPGVSQVVDMGGGLKQAQIQLIPDEVNLRQLSWLDLREKLLKLGDNTAGGFMDLEGKELLIRNMARPIDLEDVKNSVVGVWLGRPVLLKDIAKVEYGPAPARGAASMNAQPGVIITIFKSPEADTLALTRQIEKAMVEMKSTLPPGMKLHENLFKQATFIKSAMENVSKSLVEGAVLVMVILLLFLGSFRVSAITLAAIPLSFLATMVALYYFGFSVNTMTLGGLAIASGALVDDAIVNVENIFRRIKEARHRGVKSLLELLGVVFKASLEVQSSIVIATVIIILAFLPLLAMGGIEGRLFAPLGISFMVSILCSLFVSLTVTPVLSSFLLFKAKETEEAKDSWLMTRLKKIQKENLQHAINHPRLILGICAGLVFVAMIGFFVKGKEFLPPFNETTCTVVIGAPPGISLEKSDRMGALAEKTMLQVPEVDATNRRTGRAEGDEHAEGVNKSEIDVSYKKIKGERKRPVVVADIQQRLQKVLPGFSISIGAPISHRIDHMLSGVQAAVAIKIFGDDLSTLRSIARDVVSRLNGTSGLVDLSAEQQVLVPQLKVVLDREDLAKARLSPGNTADTLEMALAGETVGTMIEGQKRIDITARLVSESRDLPESIQEMRLATQPDGTPIKVSDVADVFETHKPNVIWREDMGRRIVVQANVRGRSLSGTVGEVQKRLKDLKLPTGYRYVIGGQFENQQAGLRKMVLLGAIAMIGIFLLLFQHYKSWLIALQIMVNIPLALVGSVAALWIAGGNISLASIVAFITLCGIASRNGILMISHYIHLVEQEGEKFDEHMIIRGSLERLGPVLMTALTALLGLIPFLLDPYEPGREILYPVAVVIVGGLISSTLLDLFVTPVIFNITGRDILKNPSRTAKEKSKGEGNFSLAGLSRRSR